MRKNGFEKPCESCGKLMYVKPNQVASGRGHYCSRGCANKGFFTGRTTGTEKTCEVCGKAIYLQPNQLKHGEGRYCSRACKAQDQKGKLPAGARPDLNRVSSGGYILVWAPDHPKASGKRVYEHILVAEQRLGRYMTDGEVVHHIDGNKQNNSPSNLQVLTVSEHRKRHILRVTVICQECGKPFEDKPSRAAHRRYCSRACQYKGQARKSDRPKEK